MSLSNPSVAVCIVTYNSAADLPACLESVEALEYRPLELVIVDCASQDGSVELVERSVASGLPLDVLGVVSAVAVLSVLISAQVAATHSTGFRVAVRVAGSWIAAAGLLSLGLLLRA